MNPTPAPALSTTSAPPAPSSSTTAGNPTTKTNSSCKKPASTSSPNPPITAPLDDLLTTLLGPTAPQLIHHFGSALQLLSADAHELTSIPTIGPRTARRIRALLPLVTSLRKTLDTRPQLYLTGPEDVADMFLHEMAALDREHFRAILLNTKNRILAVRTISIGSLNASIVHAREVFRAAVAEGAQAILLVHNHPSGLPEPSTEDILLTQRLAQAGKILGINIIDHIILGTHGFVSLKKMGHL